MYFEVCPLPIDRVPPHDLDAEISVLGAILLNNKIVSQITEMIKPDDMYKEAHSLIFEGIISLHRDKTDITIITLPDRLEHFGYLDRCGGRDYILSILDSVATSAAWDHHCKIIKEKSQTRQLITACIEAAETGFSKFVNNEDILNALKNKIKNIETSVKTEEDSMDDLVYNKSKEIEHKKKTGNLYTGYLTGFDNIDSKMKGLTKKTTTYLIARPSIGKSALALNIAYNIANLYDEEQVLFFSLESNKSLLLDRIISSLSGIPLSAIQVGNIADSRYPELIEAYERASLNNLWIYESTKFKRIDNLRAKCEVKASQKKISLIVIDHIQLTKHPTPGKLSRNDQLDEISSEILDISKDLDCHALVLSQLNRGMEKRQGGKPQLSDMRDSGTLEQNADNVIGLHREDKESDTAELEMLKGRDKGTWSCQLRFDRFTQKYHDKFEMKQG